MTTASKGLAAALGRAANGAVVALAEMSTEDLMASLSDDQKIALSAGINTTIPAASGAKDPESEPNETEPDSDPDDGKCQKCGDPMKDGKCAKCAPDSKASASDDRVKAVAAAVASDPACKGKAELALSMLADDDFASLSASGLVKLLGKTAAPQSSVSEGGDEASALAAMQAALAETGNSNIETGSSASQSKEASAASVWGVAYDNEFPQARK